VSSSTLAPDVDSSESSMQSGMSAAAAVTQNSAAVTTLVPAYYATLTGYASIETTLKSVVSDAQIWPDSLCGPYTTGVPGLFISFNTTFQAAAANLTTQVNLLNEDPTNASAASALSSQLQSLLTELQTLQKPMTQLQTQLVAYQKTLQNDWNELEEAIDTLSATASKTVETVSASVNVTFQMLGSCAAIVSMSSSTQASIEQAQHAGQSEAVPIALEQALLSTMINQNESATSAMSTVLDQWATLIDKYEAVIGDLESAQSASSTILAELDIDTATMAWAQLAAYAQSLS